MKFEVGDYVRDRMGKGRLFKVRDVYETSYLFWDVKSREDISVDSKKAHDAGKLVNYIKTPLWKILNEGEK